MNRKGFGQSQPPMQDAKEFMQAFMERVVETQGDQTQVHQFFASNQAKLDESLLEALPFVFKTLAEKFPEAQKNIAQLFWAFGNLIQQFPLGNWMLNLELSITAYQLALKVYTREVFPEQWAGLQNNLGIAHNSRIRGERGENLEQAIAAFELALQVYTREAFPEQWATIQNNLGNAYREHIRGERAENLERAIAAFELALQVYTRRAFPAKWAMTQNNLGTAYRNHIRGERAENLERAIAAFELALQVYTHEAFPEQWAGVQNNLGLVYRDRIRGERAENLEQAITASKLALQVTTRNAFPIDWAETQHNLANAYRDRIRGEQTDNLGQAISIYEQASQVFTREAFPENWAENRGHLAEALIQRASLTENNTDLETAIVLLKAVPPTTQSILGGRLVRDGQWQEGLQLLLNSIRQLSTGDDPLAHANALFQTGRAHETLSDYDNARLYYRDALRLYEHLNDRPGIAKSRAGLGSVLVSQGYLEKGLAELDKAHQSYHQLQQPAKADEVDRIRQAAQRAIERQSTEAYV